MRYLTRGRPTPYDEVEVALSRIISDYERFPGRGKWAAIDKQSQEFIGWLELSVPPGGDGREVELGYRLRRRSWGVGLATEGAKALVRKAFTELGIDRVFAQTMAVNLSSRRVMEKAGLVLVRTIHLQWDDPIEGSELGEVEYELLRSVVEP
jgi:RimJ/RimL family protein N-acetyltransferase